MVRRMNSRRGAALILALLVVLAGGIIITATFSFVYGYSRLAQMDRGGYVDHTTLLTYVQRMKSAIVSENALAWEMRHVEKVRKGHDGELRDTSPPGEKLALADVIFGGATDGQNPDGTSYNDGKWSSWQIDEAVTTGIGSRRVTVEVYDLYFKFDWVRDDYRQHLRFPPIFEMSGVTGGGAGGGGTGTVGGESEGEATTADTGGSIGGATTLPPERYGAYLIRAELFDGRRTNPIRTIEEVFVQWLDDQP